jgi:prepilin-type N-terminal cleavage/methylation domain-containing protein
MVFSTLYRQDKGFSLIEMLIVITIAGVLATIAVTSYRGMVKKHKLVQYGSEMEYMVKYAKIIAMERTSNTGVCIGSNTNLVIYDIGTNRGADACTGASVKTMAVTSADAAGNNISVAGSSASFDPRGLAISTGNVCVTNNARYIKACIGRTGIRMEEGAGGCTTCSP